MAYWYATLEGREAAHIEVSRAVAVVNVLDEAVFEASLGRSYRDLRAKDRLGQVVTGLELVRNCEIHSLVDAPDLLVESRLIGVPLSTPPAQVMRGVYKWAEERDLPDRYKCLSGDVSDGVRRARGEACHGYRQAVQGRVVVETLLDAVQWFQCIEPRLVVAAPFEPQYAYAEVPETHGSDGADRRPGRTFIAPLAGLDSREILLPDLATRWHERCGVGSGSADHWFAQAVKRAKKEAPGGRRTIECAIRDGDAVVAYGGSSPSSWGAGTWVERVRQVRRDVDAEFAYVVTSEDGADVPVVSGSHQSVVAMHGDNDLLLLLPDGEPPIDLERLQMVEEYPDAYLDMRVKGF